jgi:hypothetical protein
MANGHDFLHPASDNFKCLFGFILIVAMFKPVAAQPDSQICCLKAAREAWDLSSTALPWDSCAFGSSYVQGSIAPGSVPQVFATMSFCKKECPGYKLSTLSEWLLLFATWVIPAAALLIICSTGECEEARERRIDVPESKKGTPMSPMFQYVIGPINGILNKGLVWIPDAILEFTSILGDPASAIRGAFSEIALDVRTVHNLSVSNKDEDRGREFDKLMRALAMVAGQTKFDPDVDNRLATVLLSKGLLVATGPWLGDYRIRKLRVHLLEMNKKREPTGLLADDKSRWAALKTLKPAMVCENEDRRDFLRNSLLALQAALEKSEKKTPAARPGVSTPAHDLEATQSELDPEGIDPVQLRKNLIQAIKDILDDEKAPEVAAAAPSIEKPDGTKGDIREDTREDIREDVKEDVKEDVREDIREDIKGSAIKQRGDVILFDKSDWAKGLRMGIKAGLKGRVDFMKALVVPVALGLVATAGSFYTAYTSLGDNDTAHSLAYGTWFSWIIILAVASNCYIATANPGLVKLALQDEVYLSKITVPLRERPNNTRKWTDWLNKMGCEDANDPSLEPPVALTSPASPASPALASGFRPIRPKLRRASSTILSLPFRQTPGPSLKPKGFLEKSNLLFHLIAKQFAGWICVGLPCACAASISYTTPTVGLGCRSFNHMLYGILTLAISVVAVIRAYLSYYSPSFTTKVMLRTIYIMGISLNTFVLVFGTLFHLIGLYRSCVCAVLGVGGDFMLQISAITALDVADAKQFWLPVGYMDFGFVWIVCCVAVGCRGFTHYHIKGFFDAEEEEKRK